jgi:hypothetical protein
MKHPKKTFLRVSTSALFLLVGLQLGWGGSKAEEDFWAAPETNTEAKRSGIAAFPGESWVESGVFAYGNYGGLKKDEWTGAFRIEASFRDTYEFFHLRVNALLGINGVAEGAIEGQVILMDGLKLGLGASYTERAEFKPRAGLYVEDRNEPRRRGGFYLLGGDGGGIELSWPVADQWAVWGDLGEEEDNGDKYNRATFGLNYTF